MVVSRKKVPLWKRRAGAQMPLVDPTLSARTGSWVARFSACPVIIVISILARGIPCLRWNCGERRRTNQPPTHQVFTRVNRYTRKHVETARCAVEGFVGLVEYAAGVWMELGVWSISQSVVVFILLSCSDSTSEEVEEGTRGLHQVV